VASNGDELLTRRNRGWPGRPIGLTCPCCYSHDVFIAFCFFLVGWVFRRWYIQSRRVKKGLSRCRYGFFGSRVVTAPAISCSCPQAREAHAHLFRLVSIVYGQEGLMWFFWVQACFRLNCPWWVTVNKRVNQPLCCRRLRRSIYFAKSVGWLAGSKDRAVDVPKCQCCCWVRRFLSSLLYLTCWVTRAIVYV